jgi:hypothetical protein
VVRSGTRGGCPVNPRMPSATQSVKYGSYFLRGIWFVSTPLMLPLMLGEVLNPCFVIRDDATEELWTWWQ